MYQDSLVGNINKVHELNGLDKRGLLNGYTFSLVSWLESYVKHLTYFGEFSVVQEEPGKHLRVFVAMVWSEDKVRDEGSIYNLGD